MERKVIVVCCVVGFLGLFSAATGFAAEATRIKSTEVEFPSPFECVYPWSPAQDLGLASAVSLFFAKIIIDVAGGCCICCRRAPRQPFSNRTLALICFLVSGFTFVIAFLLLLTGAALNDQHRHVNCYLVKPGVFAGAALLSLVSVILDIIFYLTSASTKSINAPIGVLTPPSQGGIAMGQPEIPPRSHDPVFVHEDTYMRRQFT